MQGNPTLNARSGDLQRIDLEALENEYMEGKDGQIERGRYPHSHEKTGRISSHGRVSSARLRVPSTTKFLFPRNGSDARLVGSPIHTTTSQCWNKHSRVSDSML